MKRLPLDQVHAVCLDAGNTLIGMDFAPIEARLTELGIVLQPGAMERTEPAARVALSRHLEAGGSSEAAGSGRLYIGEILRGALALADPQIDRALAGLRPFLEQHWQRLWTRVLPGVREALATLRDAGFPIAVVTNSDGSAARKLSDAGLAAYFDVVVDSAVVGCEKPDPAIFHHAIALIRSEAWRTVHVGDLYSVDVKGARAAGLQPILLDPVGAWPPVDCAVARDVQEVARALLDARTHGQSSG